MFFLNAGFFIGITGGGGQNFLFQKNHWTLAKKAKGAAAFPAPAQNKKDQELQHFEAMAPLVDFFIGGEAVGKNIIWSNSIGISYMPLNQTIKDPRFVTFNAGGGLPQGKEITVKAPNGDDQYITKSGKVAFQARSLFGFMAKRSSFALGISGMIFNMSQDYQREKEKPETFPPTWAWMLGPCASLKINLSSHFRFVCYGEVLFSPYIKRPKPISFEEDDKKGSLYKYELSPSFKPVIWKVTAGFEVYFTKTEKEVFKESYTCNKTAKEKRIEQLRKKVLGKCHPYGYYQCRKRKR